eukprot:6180108-Prymnesium_polylepis.1
MTRTRFPYKRPETRHRTLRKRATVAEEEMVEVVAGAASIVHLSGSQAQVGKRGVCMLHGSETLKICLYERRTSQLARYFPRYAT